MRKKFQTRREAEDLINRLRVAGIPHDRIGYHVDGVEGTINFTAMVSLLFPTEEERELVKGWFE